MSPNDQVNTFESCPKQGGNSFFIGLYYIIIAAHCNGGQVSALPSYNVDCYDYSFLHVYVYVILWLGTTHRVMDE